MAFTSDWSSTVPVDHLKFKLAPEKIRDVRIDLEDRLSTILYGFVAGETFIGFKKGRFIQVGTAAPTAPPGTGLEAEYDLYSRKDGTGTGVELYGQDASGNEIQLTKVGKVPYASLESTLAVTVLALAYPVGSIYINKTVSTNPATLLGFGTWTALEGRVIVGKATAGTFASAGGTGGAETHTLTEAEMPEHSHKFSTSGADNPGSYAKVGTTADNVDAVTTTTAGSGSAHNNLQPYLIAYMWERTA